MVYRRVIPALLVAGVLSACRSATDPASAVLVSVAVAGTAVPTGTSVATTVTVANRGDEPLQIAGGGCMTYLEVRSATGELVGGDSRFCTMEFVVRPLAPGAEFAEHPVWNGRVQGGSLAPVGTYTVRGGVTISGNHQVWSAPVSVIVETP